LFAYDIHPRYDEKLFPVRLRGLAPDRSYKVEEINLMPGTRSRLRDNAKVFSGDYLMKVGLPVFSTSGQSSKVIEITAVN
ncbi:MAG: GH36 C-terminal domain-containing protein, partial [Tannerellaceae bacterium]|nr:GH36 C-terminal domain-containing protein [Tannerellaceae bacterium]